MLPPLPGYRRAMTAPNVPRSPAPSSLAGVQAAAERHAPRLREAASTGLALLLALTGCEAVTGVAAQPSQPSITSDAAGPEPAGAVLAAVPPCLNGATATLNDGLVVRYEGAASDDPEVCLVKWRGKAHRYLAGFWGSGRFRKAAAGERTAIQQALTGPVGTRTTFEDARADLWGRVTVEHVASPSLPVQGKLRRTVQIRVVRHDAHGRPHVRREAMHWIDVRTGIALQRQTVSRLPSGEQQVHTTWRVDQVTEAAS